MKFWLSLVSVGETEQMVEIAKYAEELGFGGITAADHLVMPTKIDSKYPYTPDGEVFWPEKTPWPDPWVTLATMGAVTKKLDLMTNIYLAALRDPFTAAKAISTAAVFNKGRIACGVASGWIKEEYELAGVDFASRGRRLDELLDAMRALWTGEKVSHRGEFFNFDALMCPAPKKKIPIWCGGGTKPAIRRAAKNDGWLPLPMTLAQMNDAAADIRGLRTAAGLPLEDFTICFAPAEPFTPVVADGARKIGIEDVIVIGPWIPSPWDIEQWTDPGDDFGELEVKKKAMRRYAETVSQSAPDMPVLRTPDERFANLPGYDFTPHYQTLKDPRLGDLRMHYVDEGPRDAPIALMLHGEPTWSFLYRKMIPLVAKAGYRAVAPDFIGFGRSDKPGSRADYSYQGFVDWLKQFIQAVDLRRITLVCQDWGGPIGLRTVSELTDRFDAVLATNTLLPTFEPPPKGIDGWPGEQIMNWVKTCREATDLPISAIVGGVGVNALSDDVLRGYDAPFPDASYKASTMQITCCIPVTEDMPGIAENKKAWDVIERFDKPFLTAFSDRDPSTKAWETVFRRRVPGAAGQPHTEIAGAGHFVQEEQGPALAEHLIALLNRIYR